MPGPIYNDSSCTGSVPTYLGGARGRRSFYLDDQGVLRGITYRAPWRDGENVAQCMVATRTTQFVPSRFSPFIPAAGPPYVTAGVSFPADPEAEPELLAGFAWAQCEGLDRECACGFYAYHNAETAYALSGPGCRVAAIVEAYGRMVLGTSGYRAQKARILAVCTPPATEASVRAAKLREERAAVLEQLEQLVSRPYLPGRTMRRVAAGVVAASVGGAVAPAAARPPLLLLGAFLGVSMMLMRRALRQEFRSTVESLENQLEQIDTLLHQLPADYSQHVARAKARYPSVQWFDSPAEMRAAYPIESLADLARNDGGDEDG
jgi:hypothetical protein